MLEWIQKASKETQQETLSFNDYLEILQKHPFRECRPTYQYLSDMFHYFGKNDKGEFALLGQNEDDAPAVFGQNKVQESIIQKLSHFKEEGLNNKFILLVGPNGSSKSSIVKRLFSGLEQYSKTDKGALYTFSWIFPVENILKGTLGLSQERSFSELDSFAQLDDRDISAILSSELKDHPLLLVPLEHRKKILEDLLSSNKEFFQSIQKSYLYRGDLSKRNHMIYSTLLKNYKGDHKAVLKHIRIDRFEVSRRYSTSAVTIGPQMHVDAQMQQITMDRRLQGLPPSLQSLNLFSMSGELVWANRGILEYSDLLKRPLDTYKYLLTTMETKTISIQGLLSELDILFVGTSNESHFAAFEQHPDFNSFKGRLHIVPVPYLLNYREELKIYTQQIEGLKKRCTFAPLSLEAICLFAVMTRLRRPQEKNYTDGALANIACKLNPLEKALLIADRKAPEHFDTDSKQVLQGGIKEIMEEFEFENPYEGKFGPSPRDIQALLYKISDHHTNITFLEVIEEIQKLIAKRGHYDFLSIAHQGDYHNPTRILELIKNRCFDIFDQDLRASLGMVDNRSYEDYIQRYIENITALIKGEKIRNKVTHKYEENDEFFIKEFESNIHLKENPDGFRSHLLSKLGAYSLDNPGKKILYSEVFPNLTERLMTSFREEQKRAIKNIAKNLVYYKTNAQGEQIGRSSRLNQEGIQQIDSVLEKLKQNCYYERPAALVVMRQLIKERY